MTLHRRSCLALLAALPTPWTLPARAGATTGGAALPVQLALDWADHAPRLDVRDFLVSEKFDGVRALWDGSQLRHRSGRPIAAPAAFTTALPKEALDGELWLGRGRFDAVSALTRRHALDAAAWRAVRYQVFDLPRAGGAFALRHERLQALLGPAGEHAGPARAVEQRRLPDVAALSRWLDAVVARGGEGLVLHRADAAVAAGRSGHVFKWKRERDAEAVVVGHVPGRGRLGGRLGALEVETPSGVRFRLGSGFDDATRSAPPPIGSTVTYRYRDLTPGGTPRFATYWRPAV